MFLHTKIYPEEAETQKLKTLLIHFVNKILENFYFFGKLNLNFLPKLNSAKAEKDENFPLPLYRKR